MSKSFKDKIASIISELLDKKAIIEVGQDGDQTEYSVDNSVCQIFYTPVKPNMYYNDTMVITTIVSCTDGIQLDNSDDSIWIGETDSNEFSGVKLYLFEPIAINDEPVEEIELLRQTVIMHTKLIENLDKRLTNLEGSLDLVGRKAETILEKFKPFLPK